VALAENGPTFNYEPLFSAVRDILVFGQPYEQIAEGMRRGIPREAVRDNMLGVLPLIREHFDGIAPSFVQSVGRRYYPVGRGLMVPFDPPVIYGAGGQIHFPWFSFWRSNPLTSERMSLFVTIVEEVLLEDPDLENARFVILDFSAAGPKLPRTLKRLTQNKFRASLKRRSLRCCPCSPKAISWPSRSLRRLRKRGARAIDEMRRTKATNSVCLMMIDRCIPTPRCASGRDQFVKCRIERAATKRRLGSRFCYQGVTFWRPVAR
jgi:hypothetical protein